MLSLAWKKLSICLSALSGRGHSDCHGEKPTAVPAGPAVFVGPDSYISESVKTHGKPHTQITYQGAPALKKPFSIFKCFSFCEAERL